MSHCHESDLLCLWKSVPWLSSGELRSGCKFSITDRRTPDSTFTMFVYLMETYRVQKTLVWWRSKRRRVQDWLGLTVTRALHWSLEGLYCWTHRYVSATVLHMRWNQSFSPQLKRMIIHGTFSEREKNVNHIELGVYGASFCVSPSPHSSSLTETLQKNSTVLLEQTQAKQIMDWNLFIWTSVTQKTSLNLISSSPISWNGARLIPFLWARPSSSRPPWSKWRENKQKEAEPKPCRDHFRK